MSWIPLAAATAHKAAGHAAESGGHGGIHEPPNIITLLNAWLGHSDTFGSTVHFLHQWENVFFALLYVCGIALLARVATRRMTRVPRGLQNVMELAVERLDHFVHDVIGHEGRHFVPFVGTLFFYIIVMNFAGMIPGLKSPTASINMTLALAICVFCYVQYTGITRLGLNKYVLHLLGEPQGVVGWILAPLMGVLEIIGEFVKPISLALRLFANILAEDATLGALLLLGAGALGVLHSPVGVPFHTLVYPLVVLFSTIQALVFCLLTSVYLSMKLPHAEH